jgi:hypothetical protein
MEFHWRYAPTLVYGSIDIAPLMQSDFAMGVLLLTDLAGGPTIDAWTETEVSLQAEIDGEPDLTATFRIDPLDT